MQQVIVSGTVIDHQYQIQKKLKGNTTNCCYLAEDTSQSNRLVILSFPRMALLTLPGFADVFKDACHSLTGLRINNVAKVLDNGVYESRPYAVLQYISHQPLATVLRHNKASSQTSSLDTVLDWATPLAVSLDEIHEADYMHGNIRPESIYLGAQQLILGDFITELTLQRMGKFKSAVDALDIDNYLAPEYLKSHYTPNYDQYLLATLIYEALAGQAPFGGSGSGDEYRMNVATQVPEPLSKHRPELSAVSEVLATALERNPINRYSSCRELISKLTAAQEVTPAIVPLKPAANTQSVEAAGELVKEPIITSIRQEGGAPKSKKGLVMWLGGLLLGSVAVAYTVMNRNEPKQVAAPSLTAQSPTEKAVVIPVNAEGASSEGATSTAVHAGAAQQVVKGGTDSDTAGKAKAGSKQPTQPTEQEPSRAQSDGTTPANAGADAVDIAALSNVINQAVNAGQQEFLASQQEQMTHRQGEREADANGRQEVSEATRQARETAQANLNQELLTVEALVNRREAQAKAAAERRAAAEAKKKEERQATERRQQQQARHQSQDEQQTQHNQSQHEQQPNTSEVNTAHARPDSEQANTGAATEGVATTSEQAGLSERERIRAVKQKKLARIKAITDNCVIGGKIHREAAAGNLAFVKSCMAVGVDPNIAQSNRWTLLHIAARSGHLNMAKLLIAKGARVNAKSAEGLTALDMAISQRKEKMANYLKTRGGLRTQH